MTPFQILPKETIRAWLASLVKRGAGKDCGQAARREGPTLNAIASHTGIPLDSLTWMYRDAKKINHSRQMLLSKVIAQVENGQLTFRTVQRGYGKGPLKVGTFVEKPKPIVRYGFTLGATGPKLRAIDRPPAYAPMPSFKDVLLK